MNNPDRDLAIKYLFDISPDPLCLLTADHHFLMINNTFAETFGYTVENQQQQSFLDLIHHEDKAETMERLKGLSADEAGSCFFENRFRYIDDDYKWFSWSGKKLPGEMAYVLSARDISGYKKFHEGADNEHELRHSIIDNPLGEILPAEKSFVESPENYKLLFYSNPFPIVIYDMETMAILDVNLMTTELYGYTRPEFLNLTIKDIRPPEEIPMIVEAVKKRVFNKNVNNLGTWNHIKKDGTPIKVEVIGHSIQYKGRHCMIVAYNDVTEYSATLRSLELSIERFEYVTEATSDIIWDWNLETNEVTYSSNIEKSFGHTPGGKIGDTRFFAHYVHPDDRDRVVLYPEPVKYGTMKNWTGEYRFRKANGEYAFVLDKGIVVRDANGIGIRMIGAMQDITELKNNERHILKQSDQLMEIARINAHEIRRPVASILGLNNLIDKKSITDAGNLEVLAHLDAATHELDMVIRRIIDKTID